MLYVSNVHGDSVSITDTTDNVTDVVTRNEALHYAGQVRIQGVSRENNLVYPIEFLDGKPVYRGIRLGDAEYEAYLRIGRINTNLIPVGYPADTTDSVMPCYLVDFIENGALTMSIATIVDFLDTSWDSYVRLLRLKLYRNGGTELRDFKCYVLGGGSGFSSLIPVSLGALAYVDLSWYAERDMEFRRAVDKFLRKYGNAHLDSIIPETEAYWDDSKLIYLSPRRRLPIEEVLRDVCEIVTSCGTFVLSVERRYFRDYQVNPIFKVLEELLFDKQEITPIHAMRGVSAFHKRLNNLFRVKCADTDTIVKTLCLDPSWNGYFYYHCHEDRLSDFDASRDPLRISRFNDEGVVNHLVDIKYTKNSISLRGIGDAKASRTSIPDIPCYRAAFDADVKSNILDGEYTSLYGKYDFKMEELLDFTGFSRVSKADMMQVMRVKLTTGNSDVYIHNGRVKGIAPSHHGVIILPDGCTTVDEDGILLNEHVTGIHIPNSYKSVRLSAFAVGDDSVSFILERLRNYGTVFHKMYVDSSLTISVDSTSTQVLTNAVTVMQLCYKTNTPVKFVSKKAKREMGYVLLSLSDFDIVFDDMYYTGVYNYLCTLSDVEANAVVNKLRLKCLSSIPDYESKGIYLKAKSLMRTKVSINMKFYLIADLPKSLRAVLRNVDCIMSVIRDSNLDINKLPLPIRNYCLELETLVSNMQACYVECLKVGFPLCRDGATRVVTATSIERINTLIRTSKTAYVNDLDIGW